MTGLNTAAIYVIQTLGSLYLLIVLLRFILQLVRADFYNPLSQFVVRATKPLLNPLRKIIPGFGGLDLASLVLAILVQLLLMVVTLTLMGYGVGGYLLQLLIWSIIGVTSLARSPLVPEYASLNEQGIRGFQLEIWTAAAAPRSMPQPVVDKLSKLVSEIARSPEVRQKLFQQGWQVAGTNAEGLANRIKSDTALLGGVIMMRGIKAE